MSDEFKPLQAGELTDLALLPGEFRAFRRETHDSLESIARALQSLDRIEKRLDVVIDRQNVLEARVDGIDKRLTALETKRKPQPKRKK